MCELSVFTSEGILAGYSVLPFEGLLTPVLVEDSFGFLLPGLGNTPLF